MESRTVIALDGMGGDKAPVATVKAAGAAAAMNGLEILLVGQKRVLKEAARKLAVDPSSLQIVEAEEEIGMDEDPVRAFRKKKNSSIHKGLSLVKHGKADAFLSFGQTGAVLLGAYSFLGRIKGIKKPALAQLLPGYHHAFVLLDVGASLEASPEHLVNYARLGAKYAGLSFDKKNPSIALLNIGEEASKGGEALKRASLLLSRDTTLNFIGNIEADRIWKGAADVVVANGFTGNSILKCSEGVADFILTEFRDAAKRSMLTKAGFFLIRAGAGRLFRQIDRSKYGAAVLLGVRGLCMVGHGNSGAGVIENALRQILSLRRKNLRELFESDYHQKKAQ